MADPTRLRPDDPIRRTRNVWLGPSGMTLPFVASYQAWALWFLIFGAILLVERVAPMSVSMPPLFEAVGAAYGSTLIGKLLDHNKPLSMLFRVTWQHAAAPRRRRRARHYQPSRTKLRVRETR